MSGAATQVKNQHETFQYRVRRTDGTIQNGSAVFPTREGLIRKLVADPKNESVLEVSLPGGTGVRSRARAKSRSLVVFSRTLEVCLENGIMERDAIDMIREGGDLDDPVLEYGLTEVSKSIGEGMKMSTAMAQHPYIFPPLMTATLAAGEEAAFLKAASKQAADDIEKDADMKAKIQKALTYPGIVGGLSGLIFIVLMVWVVPAFEELYDSLSGGDASLPALTEMVIAISKQMSWAVPLFGVLGLAGTIFYRFNSRQEWMERVVDPLKLQAPIFGKLFKLVALNRFCRLLASLDENGLDMSRSLMIVSDSVGNSAYRDSLRRAHGEYAAGKSVDAALTGDPLFPKTLVSFLGVGAKTGGTPKALRAMGRLYERDIDTMTSRMEAIIQPVFLVAIAGMVLIIALAIYLPYFSLGDIISPY